MDYKKVKILLDKFFNGETSLEEEKFIREFFKGDNIPSELENEKLLFNSFDKMEGESTPDPELNEELIDLIEQKWTASTKEKYYKIIKWSVSAAACLIVGLGLYFYNNPKENNVIQDTFADQQQAYDATKQVLLYISETMNSGSSKLSSLSAINDNFTTINKLNKINKTINNIKSKKE